MTDIDREFNAMCDWQRPKTHGEIRDEMIRANIEAAGGVDRMTRGLRAGQGLYAAVWLDIIRARLTPDPDPLQDPQR